MDLQTNRLEDKYHYFNIISLLLFTMKLFIISLLLFTMNYLREVFTGIISLLLFTKKFYCTFSNIIFTKMFLFFAFWRRQENRFW